MRIFRRVRRTKLRYVIALLAIAGIVVSTMALQVHRSQDTAPCSINEHWDCGIVNHSRYAEIGGVPVATIGIVGYALMAAVALLRRKRLLLVLSLGALAFALRLSYIEYHNLQVWCLYCVISQGIIALITLLALAQMFVGRKPAVAAA
jgi:uncharacterized membrane protein